jgi:hypothetical protein
MEKFGSGINIPDPQHWIEDLWSFNSFCLQILNSDTIEELTVRAHCTYNVSTYVLIIHFHHNLLCGLDTGINLIKYLKMIFDFFFGVVDQELVIPDSPFVLILQIFLHNSPIYLWLHTYLKMLNKSVSGSVSALLCVSHPGSTIHWQPHN